MRYEQRYKVDGNFDIFEIDTRGFRRKVSPDQHDYKFFLDNGGKPEVIKYNPGTFIEPPKPTDEELAEQEKMRIRNYRENKITDISTAKWAMIYGGIDFAGNQIATDEKSQALLNGAVTRSMLEDSFTFYWKVGSGDYLELNEEMIKAVAVAVSNHVEMCFDIERQLVRKVNSCATIEEIQAVTWPTKEELQPSS
jgi:hypothetical protein